MDGLWTPAEQLSVRNFYAMGQIGSPATVKAGLEQLLHDYEVDEFITLDEFMDLVEIYARAIYELLK